MMVCRTCGKYLIHWADGRYIHEDRNAADHMADPMPEHQRRYVMVFGKPCPICNTYGLFNVAGEEEPPIVCRCETCLTRFDKNGIPISSSFMGVAGVDIEHAREYFGRWYNPSRLSKMIEKLEDLHSVLYG